MQKRSSGVYASLLCLLITVSSCRLFTRPESNTHYRKAVRHCSTLLVEAKEAIPTPAISVAVGVDNRIVWAAALGYKDVEKAEPADTATRFRIGSTSKAVTSVGLGQLIQQRRLNLDASIQEYLPGFDPAKPPITIRQLAAHSSGIRNYKKAEFNSNVPYSSIQESMQVFIRDSLLFQPGSRFSYSTYNYTVLSAAIEQITGKGFLTQMRQAVFAPLQMNHTGGDYKDSLMGNRAQFYTYRQQDSTFRKAAEVDNSNKWAGGGLLSTPRDLVKLGNALLSYSLLDSVTTALLWEPQRLNDGKVNGINYAIGWKNDSTRALRAGRPVQQIHHGGSASGATAMLVLFPAYKLSVCLLINRDNFASADLLKYIYPMVDAFLSERTPTSVTRPRPEKK